MTLRESASNHRDGDNLQLKFRFESRKAVGREDFLVTNSNKYAVDFLDKWPNWDSSSAIIFGPRGCGKTHIANVWSLRSKAKFLGVKEILEKPIEKIFDNYRSFVLEDFSALKSPVQEEKILHFYNLLNEKKFFLLITLRSSLRNLSITLPDLRSRLNSIPSFEINEPDDDLLGAVLIKLFFDRQLKVDHDVILFLLKRIERSFSSLNKVVKELDNAALDQKRKITIPFVRSILKDYLD